MHCMTALPYNNNNEILSTKDHPVDEATAKRCEENHRIMDAKLGEEKAKLERRLAEPSILPPNDEDWDKEFRIKEP